MTAFHRNSIRSLVRHLARKFPRSKRTLIKGEIFLGLAEQTLAHVFPSFIRPRPKRLTIAVTAACNLRCLGCRYGRDFMVGEQLELPLVKTLLTDAKACGIELIRLYGGEPLIHPDLPAMISHATTLGLGTYVTTNGVLLDRRLDELYGAGLRNLTIGYYGMDADYDTYVGRPGQSEKVCRNIDLAHNRYGSTLSIQLNYLVSTRSCKLEQLERAWELVTRYDLTLHIDLIHYSLPYFTEGPDRQLQFNEADRTNILRFVRRLTELKKAHPLRIRDSLAGIRSIPDWLLRGPEMQVPCDARELIWVGADGSVQLCYVTFPLGNIYRSRLPDLLFTEAHGRAARDAFDLNCPNCHCERDSRIQKDLRSLWLYGR